MSARVIQFPPGMSVRSRPGGVLVQIRSGEEWTFSPDHARRLAEALRIQADLAEMMKSRIERTRFGLVPARAAERTSCGAFALLDLKCGHKAIVSLRYGKGKIRNGLPMAAKCAECPPSNVVKFTKRKKRDAERKGRRR